jgi:hypothetical protein
VVQKRTDEQMPELVATSGSQSLVDLNVSNMDQFAETEDDVCGYGHKETKQPPRVYVVFTLNNLLINSPSLPEK